MILSPAALGSAAGQKKRTMKKEYMKPQVEVVKVNMSCQILAGSDRNVTGVSGNVFNGGISGGSGGGRSRGSDDWEDE